MTAKVEPELIRVELFHIFVGALFSHGAISKYFVQMDRRKRLNETVHVGLPG